MMLNSIAFKRIRNLPSRIIELQAKIITLINPACALKFLDIDANFACDKASAL
jgi:hypothetical protein